MSQVYILSEGERFEGERVVAVYGEWDDAIAALKLSLPEPEYADAELKVDGDLAIIEAGVFYTIVRMQEVL